MADDPRLAALGGLPTKRPERERENAYNSLWGPGEKIAPKVQRTYTPIEIARRLARLWPEGVACDPCSGPDSLIDADRRSWPENDSDPDGLAYAWPARTYANPPFEDLQPWLARFVACPEAVFLCPARTHRRWYRAACARSAAHVDLDPLAFAGHASTFPAPLRLLYRGPDAPRFGLVFGDLGGVSYGPAYVLDDRQGELFA